MLHPLGCPYLPSGWAQRLEGKLAYSPCPSAAVPRSKNSIATHFRNLRYRNLNLWIYSNLNSFLLLFLWLLGWPSTWCLWVGCVKSLVNVVFGARTISSYSIFQIFPWSRCIIAARINCRRHWLILWESESWVWTNVVNRRRVNRFRTQFQAFSLSELLPYADSRKKLHFRASATEYHTRLIMYLLILRVL